MKKNVLIIILFFILISIFSANKVDATSVQDIMDGVDNFIAAGDDAGDTVQTGIDSSVIAFQEDKMQEASKTISNILFTIGIIVAVIVVGILGIKYMTGSMEEQAKVKETMIPFVVGCAVIIGAFTIWKIVFQVLNSSGL